MALSGIRAILPRLAVAAVACAAAFTIGIGTPSSSAAPASDSQGYVDSTARCTAPATVVVFGSTASSRVAICAAASGAYQYRGVRVRDGAKLVLAAKSTGDGGFVAVNNGITYTLTPSALTVSDSSGVVRKEAMVDFHGSAPANKPTTQAPPPGVLAPTTAVTPSTAPPPPLPAEVGGGSGH